MLNVICGIIEASDEKSAGSATGEYQKRWPIQNIARNGNNYTAYFDGSYEAVIAVLTELLGDPTSNRRNERNGRLLSQEAEFPNRYNDRILGNASVRHIPGKQGGNTFITISKTRIEELKRMPEIAEMLGSRGHSR